MPRVEQSGTSRIEPRSDLRERGSPHHRSGQPPSHLPVQCSAVQCSPVQPSAVCSVQCAVCSAYLTQPCSPHPVQCSLFNEQPISAKLHNAKMCNFLPKTQHIKYISAVHLYSAPHPYYMGCQLGTDDSLTSAEHYLESPLMVTSGRLVSKFAHFLSHCIHSWNICQVGSGRVELRVLE